MNTQGQSIIDVDRLELEQVYTNYTTKDGLPSNEAYCVFEDSKGYVWIGTDRGLVKYDGYEFITYTTLDGLTDNVILAINEDNKGNIWYTGLNNFQLGYIDAHMNFYKYKYYNTLKDTLSRVSHPNIYFNEIHIENSYIYIVNRILGYVKLSLKGVGEIAIQDVDFDDTIGTHLFSEGKTNFVYSDPCASRRVRLKNVLMSNSGKIAEYEKEMRKEIWPTWLRSDSVDYIYDWYDFIKVSKDSIYKVKLDFKCIAYSLNEGGYIYSLVYKKTGKKVVYFSDSPNVLDTKIKILEGAVVSGVFQNSNGRIWFGTPKNGIYYLPDFSSKKSRFKSQIEAIFPFKDYIKLKVNNEQILRYYFQSGEILVDTAEMEHLDIDYVASHFNFFGGIVINTPAVSHFNKMLFNHSIIKGYQMLSDSLSYIWSKNIIIEIKNGRVNYNYREHRYQGDHRFSFPYIQDAFCVGKQDCYLATMDGVYHYINNRIEKLSIATEKSVRNIEYNYDVNAWMYTVLGEGLTIRYDNGDVKRLTKENGLASNFVNQFYMDSTGVLWLATNKGINTCTFKGNHIEIKTALNASKILNSPNILQIYAKDSILYIGTDAGFNVVNLRSIEKKDFKDVPLILDGIEVEGEKTLTDSIFVLNHDENNITFHYTALSYNQYGNINYRYQLKGLNKNWVYTKERKAIFTGVVPGKYRFELEVQNEYGNWVALENSPQFTIDKPYWERIWFRLFIIGIIGYIVYYYVSNLRKEKRLLEDKQMLFDELNESRQKALSSQLNPHFVFNSLNSIQNFILTNRTELSSDYLSMFSKLMRFVFENSKKLYVPLSDEIEALKLYLELELVRHNNKFRYEIHIGNLKPSEIFLPSLLIQPIIENAIWHGLLHKLENDRLLEINFTYEGEHLCINIKDNGVGRQATSSKPQQKFIKKQRSSGVELTKQRLDLLCQSTGLETSFEIIDLFDENNNPNGTLVQILMPINLS